MGYTSADSGIHEKWSKWGLGHFINSNKWEKRAGKKEDKGLVWGSLV